VPVLGLAAVTAARADATIESATVENGFPKQLSFRVTASASIDITDVSLKYAISGRNSSALGKPTGFARAKNLTAEVIVPTGSSQGYIPVGSEFTYHWEITLADGTTTSGPDQKFLYLPTGQDWKSVQGDFMTVYYHGDREALAKAYLKAGVETYDKIGKKLLNSALRQTPVKVILFADEKEMSGAQAGKGSTFDSQTITCGTKHANDIVFVIPVACGSTDRTDTLRHEFGHILNSTAASTDLEGTLANLPAWLDEGTAVYAQSSAGDFADAFEAAAKSSRLIPFAQMATPPSTPSLVGVWYGEAYSMVKYLVDTGGPEKYAQYFAAIKKGARFDDALKQVYGFDVPGFEKQFLAAVGAAPGAQPTAAPTQRPQQNTQPTRVPTQRSTAATATNGSSSDGLSNATVVIIGVAVMLALLAVLSFLVSAYLQNQRARPVPVGPSSPSGQPPPPGPGAPPDDRDQPRDG
jgi:hypothetical protein